MTTRWFARLSLAGAMAGAALLLAGRAPAFARGAAAPAGLTFVVNSSADVDDANPGDGVCATAGGVCTLRAAVQEANAHPGADTIQLQADTTYFPNHTESGLGFTADLVISNSLTLLGAGPDSTVIDGSGVVGHRVLYITGTVVISGVTIAHGSEATNLSWGGGIYNTGELTLVNTDLVSNTASVLNAWGGAIANDGDLTVTDSLISGNRADGDNAHGGGLMNAGGGTLALVRTTVSDNLTAGQGGGVYGATRIVDSTFSGNEASAGGAVEQINSPLVLINSTLSGNSASGSGGGLEAFNGEADLFNTTVADNRANANGVSAGVGGGLHNAFGQLKLFDSLVAGNNVVQLVGHFPRLNPDDCAGAIQAAGFNLIDFIDTSHCAVTGSPLSGDPLLGPLQANGGPTLTQALLPGSPAIDAGDPVCTDDLGAPLTADQRGAPRPANGATATRCDLGAYEAQRLLALPLVLR